MLFGEMAFPDTFWVGAVGSLVFGLFGVLLLMIGFKAFEWITPKLNVEAELEKNNVSVAAVVVSIILAVAYMAAHVIH